MYTPSQPCQGSTELTQSELMEAIARRFYFDDVSKMQIGNEFGISRFRVARLLEKARAIGMVRIEISNVGVNIDELALLGSYFDAYRPLSWASSPIRVCSNYRSNW